MGSSAGKAAFTEEELDVYEACTCLSAAEILELFSKYQKLGGSRPESTSNESHYKAQNDGIPKASEEDMEAAGTVPGAVQKVSMAKIIGQPEFAYNPFAEGLCRIFSSVRLPARGPVGTSDADPRLQMIRSFARAAAGGSLGRHVR